MKKYLLGYFGGDTPNSPEEGKAHMAKWQQWIESLGDKIINPGTPLTQSKMINASGELPEDSYQVMKGFAVIKAESMDQALEIAKTDPFLVINGTLRVAEMMDMPGS